MHLRDKEGMTVRGHHQATTSSSPPAPAARAGSAPTSPSTARRCATPGFDGFRVLLFQQKGGLKQATGDDAGLEINPPFF